MSFFIAINVEEGRVVNKLCLEVLEHIIEKKRQELHSLFKVNNNFQSEEIMNKSLELDLLINRYMYRVADSCKSLTQI
jgi:hypothetical protein